MAQIIRRGILTAFDNTTYTATVLIIEATSHYITSVPCNTMIDGTSAQIGAPCAVLFFDETNSSDAVVLAVYPNDTQGVPSPAPGRVVFVTGTLQVNSVVINSGVTTNFAISGTGGIPTGAKGIVYKAYFNSASAGAYIEIQPKGATTGNYVTIGNLPTAGGFLNENGIVALSSDGSISIKANAGNCTVTLYTHGYIN